MPFIQQCNGDTTTIQAPSGLSFSDLAGRAGLTQIPATTFPVAGFPSPTPIASGQDAPIGANPSVFVQDNAGNWHPQAFVDTTTADGGSGNGPADPPGILTWCRRQNFRDTWNQTQGGKNAFMSIQHVAGAGTLQTNQDRAIWVGMSNITAAVQSFTITNNVVSVTVNTIQTGFGTGTTGIGFRPPQIVQITGLATGAYLNGINFTVQTASAPGSTQTLTLTNATFTHANVGLTIDSGRIDQVIYSMENIQAELDVMGAPKFVSTIDTELSTFSAQLADFHTGALNPPNGGVAGFRCSYFREAGAGYWGSIPPAGLRITVANLSNVDAAGSTLQGLVVSMTDNSSSVNLSSTAIKINAPNTRYAAGNYGLDIAPFGTNAADFAIRTSTGQVSFGGPVISASTITSGKFVVASLPVGVEGQQLYATNGRKIGEGSGAGTGVPVYFSSGSWRRYSDDSAVLA